MARSVGRRRNLATGILLAALVAPGTVGVTIPAGQADDGPAPADVVVTDAGDGHDADPGDGACATADGRCTLRAAVEHAGGLGVAGPIVRIQSAIVYLTDPQPVVLDGISVIGQGGDPGTDFWSLDDGGLGRTASGTQIVPAAGGRLFEVSGDVKIHSLHVRVPVAAPAVPGNGGCLAVAGSGTLDVVASTFEGCAATGDGGALVVTGSPTVTLDNVRITRSAAQGSGGAVAVAGPALVVLVETQLADNVAGLDGGALAVLPPAADGTTTLDETGVDANVAAGNGGGVAVAAGAKVLVSASSLTRNVAGASGGGLFAQGGGGQVIGTTIHSNRAAQGGGLAVGHGGSLPTHVSTIAANVASVAGGGTHAAAATADQAAGSVVIDYSVIGTNEAPAGPDCSGILAGPSGEDTESLLGTDMGCSPDPDAVTVVAGLGFRPLADYGGEPWVLEAPALPGTPADGRLLPTYWWNAFVPGCPDARYSPPDFELIPSEQWFETARLCDVGAVTEFEGFLRPENFTLFSTPLGLTPPLTSIPARDLAAEVADEPARADGEAPATVGLVESLSLSAVDFGSSPLSALTLGELLNPTLGLDGVSDANLTPTLADGMRSVRLSDLDITGGVTTITAGTPLDDIPPQSVTLLDVAGDTAAAGNLAGVAMDALDVRGTPLASLPLASLPLASLPLDQVPVPGASAPYLPAWCGLLADLGGASCADLGIDDPADPSQAKHVTLVALAMVGVPLASLPLASLPLASLPLASLPLASLPLASLDLEISPLASLPLASLPLASLDLGSAPLASLPLASLPLASLPLASLPLASLPLASLPLASLPLASLPLASLPLASLAVSTSPLASLPLASLPLASLSIVVDCTAHDCTAASLLGLTLAQAQAAGLLRPGANLGALDGAPALEPYTLGDLFATIDDDPLLAGFRLVDIMTPAELATEADRAAARTRLLGSEWDTNPLADVLDWDDLTLGDIVDVILGREISSPGTADTIGDLLAGLDTEWAEQLVLLDLLIGLLSVSDFNFGNFSLDHDRLAAALRRGGAGGLGEEVSTRFVIGGTSAADVVVPAILDVAPTDGVAIDGLRIRATGDTDDLVLDAADAQHLPDGTLRFEALLRRYTPYTVTPVIGASRYEGEFEVAYAVQLPSVGIAHRITVDGHYMDQSEALDDAGFLLNGLDNQPSSATFLFPDDLDDLQFTAITYRGDRDFFALNVDDGDRLGLRMTGMDIDLDVGIFTWPASTDARPLGSAGQFTTSPTDPEAADQKADAEIPYTGLDLVALSTRPGTQDEEITTPPLPAGSYFAVVWAHNGATSPTSAALQFDVSERVGFLPDCMAPVTRDPAAVRGTSVMDRWPAAQVDSLFVVNRQRIEQIYGAAAADQVMAALGSLIGEPASGNDPEVVHGGVHGAILAVDDAAFDGLGGQNRTVPQVYGDWDASPCSPAAANEVANRVAALVDETRSNLAGIEYLTIVGADDLVPFHRLRDRASTSNEFEYALALGNENNPLMAALGGANLLSDDPYADQAPIDLDDRDLYIPTIALGRLVETPEQILAGIDRFIASDGVLDPDASRSDALVTGYDFLADAADEIAQRLGENGLSPVDVLTSATWAFHELATALFGSDYQTAPQAAPEVISLNAHFDEHRLLTAAGNADAADPVHFSADEVFTTDDVQAVQDAFTTSGGVGNVLGGRLLFSIGCHAGLNTVDAGLSQPAPLDWAELTARQGGVLVANTGFGYGDTEIVDYSERIMERFADHVGEVPIGVALAQAKSDYFALFPLDQLDGHRTKSMMQATMYGLPMYRLPSVPAPAALSSTAEDPGTPPDDEGSAEEPEPEPTPSDATGSDGGGGGAEPAPEPTEDPSGPTGVPIADDLIGGGGFGSLAGVRVLAGALEPTSPYGTAATVEIQVPGFHTVVRDDGSYLVPAGATASMTIAQADIDEDGQPDGPPVGPVLLTDTATEDPSLVVSNKPVQPRVQFGVGTFQQPGQELVAIPHGVLVTSMATTLTDAALDPVIARPTIDLATTEPEPLVAVGTYPVTTGGLAITDGPLGDRHDLVFIPGTFIGTGVIGGTGEQFQVDAASVEVLYHTSDEFVAPRIDVARATRTAGGDLQLAVHATDPFLFATPGAVGESEVSRVIVLHRIDGSSQWSSTELALDPNHRAYDPWQDDFSDAANWWTATLTGVPTEATIDFVAQAVDDEGNVGFASGRGNGFEDLPDLALQVTGIDLDGNNSSGTDVAGDLTFQSRVSVTVAGAADATVHYAVRDRDLDSSSSPRVLLQYDDGIDVARQGNWRVEVVASDGRTATADFAITGDIGFVFGSSSPADGAAVPPGSAVALELECADAVDTAPACVAQHVRPDGVQRWVFDGDLLDVGVGGVHTLRLWMLDDAGTQRYLEQTFTTVALEGSPAPVGVGQPWSLTIVGSGDTTATIDWGDRTSTSVTGQAPLTLQHAYNTPGLYTVAVTIGSTTLVHQYAIVYDSAGGRVTGGGQVPIPQGSLSDQPTLEGTAEFGLVAQYNGSSSTTPVGSFDLDLSNGAATLSFSASAVEWVVAAGGWAVVRGVGTLDGKQDLVGFEVVAVDGDVHPGVDADRLRVRLFSPGGAVLLDTDAASQLHEVPGPTTNLTHGQLTFHPPRKGGRP